MVEVGLPNLRYLVHQGIMNPRTEDRVNRIVPITDSLIIIL